MTDHDDAPALAESAASAQPQAGLFGRGLLYVVVFSLQTIAATVVSPVLTHMIGPDEFGKLASAIALYQLLSALVVIGLDQAIVIIRADDTDNRNARGLLAVSFALTAAVTLVLALTGPYWSRALGFGSFTPLLVATLLWTVTGACVQVMLALLLAEDRLRPFAIVSALAAVGGQVFGLILLAGGSNTASTYAWGAVISQSAAMLIGFVATRPRLRGLVELRAARAAYRLGVPLAVGSIASFVLNAGDRIVIQRFLGATEVGRYQVAYTVGYVVVLLLIFTSQAWTPRFAAIRDRTERLALTEHSRTELYRLLMPMILGITLAAPLALRIVAPPSFRPETLTLVVFLVALSAVPVASSGASTRELFILRRGHSIAMAAVSAAVLNVALNLLLVPYVGIAGSAAATVLAFVLQAALQVRALPTSPRWPRTPLRIWLGILCACGVSAASTFLPQSLEWNLARLFVGLCCLPWFVARLIAARTGESPAWATRFRLPSR